VILCPAGTLRALQGATSLRRRCGRGLQRRGRPSRQRRARGVCVCVCMRVCAHVCARALALALCSGLRVDQTCKAAGTGWHVPGRGARWWRPLPLPASTRPSNQATRRLLLWEGGSRMPRATVSLPGPAAVRSTCHDPAPLPTCCSTSRRSAGRGGLKACAPSLPHAPHPALQHMQPRGALRQRGGGGGGGGRAGEARGGAGPRERGARVQVRPSPPTQPLACAYVLGAHRGRGQRGQPCSHTPHCLHGPHCRRLHFAARLLPPSVRTRACTCTDHKARQPFTKEAVPQAVSLLAHRKSSLFFLPFHREDRREVLEAIRREKRAYGKTATAGGNEVRWGLACLHACSLQNGHGRGERGELGHGLSARMLSAKQPRQGGTR